MRATRAHIDLGDIRHNLRELERALVAASFPAEEGESPSRRVPESGVRRRELGVRRVEARDAIWPVLKADAYGHGAGMVATMLEREGVGGLCVALLEEGIELRRAGVRCPILVMGGHCSRVREGAEALIEHALTPVLHDAEQVRALGVVLPYLDAAAPLRVHVKIDTGMGRLGAPAADLAPFTEALRHATSLRVEAAMTHFACAEQEDLLLTTEQLACFRASAHRLQRALGLPRLSLHAANSAAVLRHAGSHLDHVRPGIALFGAHPCPGLGSGFGLEVRLRGAMRVVTEIVALRELPRGASLGYGHAWQAPRDSRIATLPIGYADGLSRRLAGRGHVLVCGRRAPIVGAVSMDHAMVDVTDIPGAAVRDEVVVLGRGRGRLGDDVITAQEIADHMGTIPWEVLTSVSRRVPRFYTG